MRVFDWRLLAAPMAAVACSSGPVVDSASAEGDGAESAAPIAGDVAAPVAPQVVEAPAASVAGEIPEPVAAPASDEPASSAPAKGVANLPYARGATFASLDDYLAYLEKQGAIDLPWWREISPGVYERVVRMPGAGREVKTRAELMELYGFKG